MAQSAFNCGSISVVNIVVVLMEMDMLGRVVCLGLEIYIECVV